MRVEALEVAGGTRPAGGGRDLPVCATVELGAGGAEPEVIVETRSLDSRQLVGRSQGVKDRLRLLAGNVIAATVTRAIDSYEGEMPASGVLSEHHSRRWIVALRTGRIQSKYSRWRFWQPAPSPARQRAPYSLTPGYSPSAGTIHSLRLSRLSYRPAPNLLSFSRGHSVASGYLSCDVDIVAGHHPRCRRIGHLHSIATIDSW